MKAKWELVQELSEARMKLWGAWRALRAKPDHSPDDRAAMETLMQLSVMVGDDIHALR